MSGPRDDPGSRIRRALENALAPWLAANAPLVLAVSGGPDSTALMHAAAACRPATLFVATVDHGLRPESAAEAQGVGCAAAALGLPHAILRWEGAHPGTAIQATARAARYRLLAAHARSVGATGVLTGHTRDDQAETVLMRLVAGSGPAGLSGMRRERPLAPGLVLARPFLDIAKADLVAWCEAEGIRFVRDPSNADERYGRVRLRRLLPLLASEGLTSERWARIAERAARDDAALAAAADAAFRQAVSMPLSRKARGSPLPGGEGQGEGRDLSGEFSSLTPTLSRTGEGAAPLAPPSAGYRIHTSHRASRRAFPPPSAGEGGPRVSEGRERGATSPDAALPSPPLLRRIPSPASGGGDAAAIVPLHLDGRTLAALPDAVALRVIDLALDRAGGTLPPRLERLERLVLEDLLPAFRSGNAVRRTLRGLLIAADAAGRVTIRPAPPRKPRR